jgi:hypothetical protein
MIRRPDIYLEQEIVFPFDHAQVTASKTLHVWKVPAGRAFVVDRVAYVNETGLAQDATNAFAGALKNGSTVIANLFNTDSDQPGADNGIPAGGWVEGALSATPADLAVDGGEDITLALTLSGTQTLPAGHLVIEGRLQ